MSPLGLIIFAFIYRVQPETLICRIIILPEILRLGKQIVIYPAIHLHPGVTGIMAHINILAANLVKRNASADDSDTQQPA